VSLVTVKWGLKMNDLYKWDSEKYFADLEAQVIKEYEVASEARSKGLDPVKEVESPLAVTMTEKAVRLVAVVYPDLPIERISKRMGELEGMYGQLDTTVSFVIAREIAEGKFGKFKDQLEAIDAGIRVGFAYMTLGVVVPPIEGYTGLRLGKTREGKDYFIASFSGPIRSAGTTSVCVVLMLIDYLREHFGYAKFDPSGEEVKRYVTENTDFHERVTNLQYFPTEEEMAFLASHLPFQIDGDPTSRLEVSNYKDLPRVHTNFIRGGMCLAFSEGLAQKAGKALGRLKSVKDNELVCTGWDWLVGYLELHKKREGGDEEVVATYIKDLVAGRPVYGHPSRSGGFRIRYGRGRTSGFSAVSVHPATMGISNGFLSNGTQLKIEKPTKGCIITSNDGIDGPIVKMKDGSVKRISNFEEAKKIYGEVDEIIYLGDMLFPVGDVMDRNSDLLRPGYVEEWWDLELKEKLDVTGEAPEFFVSPEEAMRVSLKYSIPLHPRYIFYWTQIMNEDFLALAEWLNKGVWRGGENGKLVLPWEKSNRENYGKAKRALEILGIEHSIVLDNVVISDDAKALLVNLGRDFMMDGEMFKLEGDFDGDVLKVVNGLSKFKIKDKAGSFIGARMGRPEKAKPRHLTGSPNVLFPVSDQGGRLRSVQDAVEAGFVKSNWPLRKCEKCGDETIYPSCEKCGGSVLKSYHCRGCFENKDDICKLHDNCFDFSNRKIDVKYYFATARALLGYEDFEVPPMVKGVKSLNNNSYVPENLAKGILRAKFNLSVNKDGTVRYDGTEIPLTHFKPFEIRVSIEKLKSLGYDKDIHGEELLKDDQVLELKPHDIVMPSCSVTKDEKADDVFLNIANFVDEELARFYKMDKYYNLKSKEDLVGRLVVCMAPHNCAGVIGRIIGWSEMQGIVASPYMHAAIRRDCDGDEAAVMLLMDVLLNFSRKFLPGHRGGSQDAPLVLNSRIRASEVDDQILFLDTGSGYSLDFYRLAEKGVHSVMAEDVELVRDKMKEGEPFIGAGFTHDTSDLNLGYNNGAYKILPTMKEKVDAQMDLVKKIRAVDTDDVARLILERHFLRDIRGNLRKFARQQFRCSSCNEKFRRPPLSGVCTKCGGRIIFTISEGSIKKYLDSAMSLTKNYNLSSYTKEGVELTRMYIESIFGKGEKDAKLGEF